MDNKIKYKDYLIVPGAWKIRDKEAWSPRIQIEYHTGGKVEMKNLTVAKNFPTEQKAIECSIIVAKNWIDGKYD
jgi:hypothetical protein